MAAVDVGQFADLRAAVGERGHQLRIVGVADELAVDQEAGVQAILPEVGVRLRPERSDRRLDGRNAGQVVGPDECVLQAAIRCASRQVILEIGGHPPAQIGAELLQVFGVALGGADVERGDGDIEVAGGHLLLLDGERVDDRADLRGEDPALVDGHDEHGDADHQGEGDGDADLDDEITTDEGAAARVDITGHVGAATGVDCLLRAWAQAWVVVPLRP